MPILRADLLNMAGLQASEVKNYAIALEHMQECVRLRDTATRPDHGRICNSLINLGQAFGSLSRFEDSLACFSRAELLCVGNDKVWIERLVDVDLATSQAYRLSGRFQEARDRLAMAESRAKELNDQTRLFELVSTKPCCALNSVMCAD